MPDFSILVVLLESRLFRVARDLPNPLVEGLQAFVHLPVDIMVKRIVELVVLPVRFKDLAHTGHGPDGGFKIRVQLQPDGCVYGGTQSRSLIDVGFGRGYSENICRNLHGIAALAAAP